MGIQLSICEQFRTVRALRPQSPIRQRGNFEGGSREEPGATESGRHGVLEHEEDFFGGVPMHSLMRIIMSFAGPFLCLVSASSQNSAPPEPYDIDEAYQIYSLLIPHEEAYEFGKATAIIQEDTVTHPFEPKCIEAKAADRFKEAIADYNAVQKRTWLLQRRFQIERPYELVRSDTIQESFNERGPDGWQDFKRRYPDSGGFIILSPVGFNKSKTLAVVYTGSGCGGLCGRWSFHLFEKDKTGRWKGVAGATCITMS
jgi:hypothetical protein